MRRFRFSLRTLLLLVLLIAGAGGLWHDWAPWAIAYSITEPALIRHADFTSDERSFYTLLKVAKQNGEGFENLVTVRDAGNGALRFSVRGGFGGGKVYFPDSDYFSITGDVDRNNPRSSPKREVWDLQTGAKIDPVQYYRPGFVFELKDGKYVLFKLPERRRIDIEGLAPWAPISRDRKWIVRLNRDYNSLSLLSLETERAVRELTWPPGDEVIFVSFSSAFFTGQNDRLIVNVSRRKKSGAPEPEAVCYVFDVASGKMISELGSVAYESAVSPDGKYLQIFDEKTRMYIIVELADTSNRLLLDTPGTVWYGFSSDSRRILGKINGKLAVWDIHTGALIWRSEFDGHFAPSGEYALSRPNHDNKDRRMSILNGRTGEIEFVPSVEKAQAGLLTDLYEQNLKDNRFLSHHAEQSITTEGATDLQRVVCWYKRGPVAWWGIAWLPVFWVTVVLVPALMWSAWRDWRELRKAA